MILFLTFSNIKVSTLYYMKCKTRQRVCLTSKDLHVWFEMTLENQTPQSEQ